MKVTTILFIALTTLTTLTTASHSPCAMLKLLNVYRRSQGRRSVYGNSLLDAAAARHCSNLIRLGGGRLDHYAGGTTPGQRATMYGYRWSGIAENIASNKGVGVMNFAYANSQWIRSSGHRYNMLGSTYVHAGHAACYGSDGYSYFVQTLARGGSGGRFYSC